MTNLPYGADTIVIPLTFIPSAISRPAQPTPTPSDPEQNAHAPDQATMNPTSS